LKQILINPLTEQAYQRYCDLYYQYPLIAYFLQLGTPYNFVNPSIIDDALTNTTSVLSKKLANNLFFTKMESATLFSIIINAIDLNAIELFKIILKNQPTLVRCSLSWNRCSLLHQACFAHSFEIVDLLLKNKADVNLYQTIRIERAKESREFLIRNILNPSALQFAIFSATLKQDMPQTKKLVDLLLRYQSDPDLEYRDDDFGLISTRKFCQIVLGLPLSPDPEKAKQAMEFNEILTSIVKFYPNKNQSVVLAQDDESRNELPEENRIKFNY
jgi:ankyrin repeat protein